MNDGWPEVEHRIATEILHQATWFCPAEQAGSVWETTTPGVYRWVKPGGQRMDGSGWATFRVSVEVLDGLL
jgi:hypothetical protein